MYLIISLWIIYCTAATEAYNDEQRDFLNELLSGDALDSFQVPEEKRGWEPWDISSVKEPRSETKRAWEAIGYRYGRRRYSTLDQLKRGWEGINWRYGWKPGKRNGLNDKNSNPKESSNFSNSCMCCTKLKNSLCCLSCLLENESFARDIGKENQSDSTFIEVLCECCINSENKECCHACGLLRNH